MEKVGRNDPCLCGSGKKFKKCCIDKSAQMPPDVKIAFEKMQAQQRQAEKQQGLGRPIISNVHQGYRFVAVGNRLHHSKSWLTFHDFLFDFLKTVLGKDWGQAELAKPEADRHPIMRWMQLAHEHMKEHEVPNKKVKSTPMSGAVFALLNLSYNLYLLGHNAELRDRLLERLRRKDGFEATLYETFVAAIFINAGFEIALEDEGDPTTHHGEFVATAPGSRKKYSLEAKHRQAGKDNAAVRNQLYAALKKNLPHERVVFIDLNIPKFTMDKIEGVIKEMDAAEKSLTINGAPAPAAYVFVTNHSFAYDLSGISHERTGFAHGFKIDEFKIRTAHTSIREAVEARERHKEMDGLASSIKQHATIPSTFDGEIPLFAFDEAALSRRLLIGNHYRVPTQGGVEEVGILETATVVENEKLVYGAYRLNDGSQIICTVPIGGEEIEAYREHPDTFFGVPREVGKKAEDPIELYDFFHNAYRRTPKERLLEFMKDWQDFETMKALSQEELAKIYCERAAYGAMAAAKK